MKKLRSLAVGLLLSVSLAVSSFAKEEYLPLEREFGKTYYTTISGKECRLATPVNTPEKVKENQDILDKIKANNKIFLVEQMKLPKPTIADLFEKTNIKENIKLLDILLDRIICQRIYGEGQLHEYYSAKKEFEEKTTKFLNKVIKTNPENHKMIEVSKDYLKTSANSLRELEKTFLFLINHYRLGCKKLPCKKTIKL